MRAPTAKQVARWAAVSSALMLLATVIFCANIAGPGRGGNLGAAMGSMLFLLLTIICAGVAVYGHRVSRRAEPRGFEPVLPADSTLQQSRSAGDQAASVSHSQQTTGS